MGGVPRPSPAPGPAPAPVPGHPAYRSGSPAPLPSPVVAGRRRGQPTAPRAAPGRSAELAWGRPALPPGAELALVGELVEGDVLLDNGTAPLNAGMGATVRAVEPSRWIGPGGTYLRVTLSHGYVFNLPADDVVAVRR